jgi:hypothetical protein
MHLPLDRQNEVVYTRQDGFSHLAEPAAGMGFFRSEPWSSFPDRERAFLFLTVSDSQADGIGWLRAYLEAEQRYGRVVARAGPYVVVEAKPHQDGAQFSALPGR